MNLWQDGAWFWGEKKPEARSWLIISPDTLLWEDPYAAVILYMIPPETAHTRLDQFAKFEFEVYPTKLRGSLYYKESLPTLQEQEGSVQSTVSR